MGREGWRHARSATPTPVGVESSGCYRAARGVDVATNSQSGDFAGEWEHVFLLGKAAANRRPGSRPPRRDAPIGWKIVAGYPVLTHAAPAGLERYLDNRPSWKVPPLWEAPSR
jgi:hypothetical protein